MATTSLRHIEGRLKDLIDYVENPDKTVAQTQDLQDFYNVFAYVQRPEATEQGEYVSAINCLKEIALQKAILEKYAKDNNLPKLRFFYDDGLSLLQGRHLWKLWSWPNRV